jgi:hypothetical protein
MKRRDFFMSLLAVASAFLLPKAVNAQSGSPLVRTAKPQYHDGKSSPFQTMEVIATSPVIKMLDQHPELGWLVLPGAIRLRDKQGLEFNAVPSSILSTPAIYHRVDKRFGKGVQVESSVPPIGSIVHTFVLCDNLYYIAQPRYVIS